MSNPTLLGTGGHHDGTYSTGTYYSNVGLGRSPMLSGGFMTESQVSQTIRVPGTISHLSWRLDSPFSAALTLSLNKNSTSTALAISIPSFTSGWITDSTDSVSVSSGDTLDFAANVASTVTYSDSFYCISARFDASTGSAQLIAAVGPSSISPSTMQKFTDFLGIAGGAASTESQFQFYCLAEGTWQNMACHVSNNGFNRNTIIANRIGSSNGLMAVIVPTGTSGHFEDTTHSDTVSVGDLLDYGVVASTSGSGSFTLDWIGAHFLASDSTLCMIGGSEGGFPWSIGHAATYYFSLMGGGAHATDVPRATGLFPYALTASKFTNFLTAADLDGAATFTLLKNGSASGLAITSGAGDSGYIMDDTLTVSFALGDTCANQITGAGDPGSSVSWASGTLLLQAG